MADLPGTRLRFKLENGGTEKAIIQAIAGICKGGPGKDECNITPEPV
jgi:hypothetical protein